MVVKWVLGSITTNKASEGDGIPADLFKILKDEMTKVTNPKIFAYDIFSCCTLCVYTYMVIFFLMRSYRVCNFLTCFLI